MKADTDVAARGTARIYNRAASHERQKTITGRGTIRVSAPGRICLFGEHQDYLGFPVIAAAINLRIKLQATPCRERRFRVELADLGQTLELPMDRQLGYSHGRDYLPAAVNVLRRNGLQWQSGWDVVVQSTIPINAGASSSSALQVAWCALLYAAAGNSAAACDPLTVAQAAHQSEVTEFGAPGGMMDHFSSAFGGLIWFDPSSRRVERLNPWPGEFVLVNSGIPKDTNGLLGSVRKRVERLNLDAESADTKELENLDAVERAAYDATMENRQLTRSARQLLENSTDQRRLGELLSRHHRELIRLGVSHPEIDRLLPLAAAHGGLGGKINGSGGGGSFFILAPGCSEQVKVVYTSMGLDARTVRIGPGVKVHCDNAGEQD